MPDKNCLTCKWEPEWREDKVGPLGNCKYPLPPGAAMPVIWICEGQLSIGFSNMPSCPAHQPKHEPQIARIVACAIQDMHGLVCSLPAPARHHHILQAHGGLAGQEQGFLTSEGLFVDRRKAHAIATRAGQIVHRCGGDDETLYSENLW